MKRMVFAACMALVVSACSRGPVFRIEGNVSGAGGRTLCLEASGIEGVIPLDSLRLKEDGAFRFSRPSPGSPEFYRLRIEDKVINFSIDSTETVRIDAPYIDFSTAYTVEGSENSLKIKELVLKQIALQNKADALLKAARDGRIGYNAAQDSLSALVREYKDDVKGNYILQAPNTAAAYFALFQKLGNYLLFDPLNNKDDVKCFAAVATSLNLLYPDAVRTKNLCNIVLKGMGNTRQPQAKTWDLPPEKIAESGIIDIALRDMKGNVHKLSDLKGKVVILDFTVFQSPAGSSHNLMLRELYNEYASKGLEIYQISLDADEHFWKTSAGNLPWICVRDGNGVYSTNLTVYNVRQLPSYFLIDRNNDVRQRGEDIKDLPAAVRALL